MKKISTPYEFEGRIPLAQAIPLGLQHVMAMFIGNLTPLIIVMGLCGLTADAGYGALRTALLQNAMIMAGIVTLVQMFSIGPVGGKVPIVMGTSSGFLGVLNNTVAACGGGILAYSAIMGACIVGGIFEGVLGMFLKPLRRFFPAIVTGSVVIAIGLSLLGVGINYFCGGSGKADYGSLPNLFLGFVVLIVIILLKHFAPQDSVLSSAAILFGILAGYVVAVIMTLVLPTVGINADGAEYTYSWVVNFEQIKNAAWIAVPSFIGFGALADMKIVFQANAIIPIGIMFIVTAICSTVWCAAKHFLFTECRPGIHDEGSEPVCNLHGCDLPDTLWILSEDRCGHVCDATVRAGRRGSYDVCIDSDLWHSADHERANWKS